VIATSAPSAASAFAIAAPIPLLAPVTRARLPVSVIVISIYVMIDTKLFSALIDSVKSLMCFSLQKENGDGGYRSTKGI
jgi:hypothetical protein